MPTTSATPLRSPWWTASLDSDLLVFGVTRTTPPPVLTFEVIESKFKSFEKTYLELLEILRRVRKTIDVLDNLNYCSLHQTLDEYDDFRHDANTLRKSDNAGLDAGRFKRPLELPTTPPYQIPRYVYNDEGIRQLEKKIDWQVKIMQHTMSDIVLRYYIQAHKQSEVRPGGKEHESGSLGNTIKVSPNQQVATELLVHQYDDDGDNILHLYDCVERLHNRLTRTSPRVNSPIDYSDSPLDSEEIGRVILPLKARFQKARTDMPKEFIGSIDEKRLAKYSQECLERLRAKFPKFVTRKRVYFEVESGNNSRTQFDSSGSYTHDKIDGATMTIQRLNLPNRVFNLTIVDIVSDHGQKSIVTTDGPRSVGLRHIFPPGDIIYPATSHRRVASSTHDTEAGSGKVCVVYLTGNEQGEIKNTMPLYNFPSSSDMLAFQCVLRDKLIRHTFEVDSILSKPGPRALKTYHEHLKLWSDFNDRNYTLSFSSVRGNESGKNLEYPVECFDPKPEPQLNNPVSVRLYFRLPPELPMGSRGSTSSIVSSGAIEDKPKRPSVSKSKSASSEISQSPSPSRKRFSWKRNSSDESTPQSGPSSESMKSQLSTDTPAESKSHSTTGHPFVHPDAKELMYLDITFSNIAHGELFRRGYPAAIPPKSIKFIENSDFTTPATPKEQITPQILRPDFAKSFRHSPEALRPAGDRYRLLSVPVLEGIPPSVMNEVPGAGRTPDKPFDSSSHIHHGGNVPRAFSNTDALGRLESHLSEGSQAPSRNPVSRMSGEIEATSRRLTFPDHIERDMSKSLPSRHGTGLSSATGRSISSTSFDDYTVGWICALSVELAAAIAMLDERHPELSLHRGDDNPYFYGSIGHHKVVIGCLPAGMTGNNSAASVATGMARSFPNLSIRVMVGIGGGIPSVRDIRLGDVVVSKPGNHHGGVVQYDFGKTTMGGKFEKIGSLPPPPSKLLHAIARLEALRVIDGSKMSEYLKVFDTEHRRKEYSSPGRMRDVLFKADYNHVQGEATCDRCDPNRVEDRADRDSLVPFVHYGAIASGNQVMRDALSRDVLGKQFDVLCFEMEAAGLVNMGAFPCLVIRGICDYADTHKNKEWQGYAAATAAAYAKEVLMNIPPSHNHG